MVKVVIIGSEAKYWTLGGRERAYREIRKVLTHYAALVVSKTSEESYNDYSKIVLVSGGCPKGGVDLWAEAIASVLGVLMDIKESEVKQWNDRVESLHTRSSTVTIDDFTSPMISDIGATVVRKKGYKSRNIEMAKSGDVIYCIDPSDRGWSGAKWTAKYAADLGKEVHYINVDNENDGKP